MPQLVDPRLEAYCTALSTPMPDLLGELERETHLKTIYPQMLTGPWQGRFLTMMTSLISAKAVLEIGTFTGYSAICFALGLQKGGHVDTIEVNDEKEPLIRKYFSLSGMEERIRLHIGDALQVLPKLSGPWDLVFLDAHKPDYPAYFDLVIDKLNPGGLILADNVLWSGKVIEATQDEDTRGLDAFNRKVAADPRVEQVILPLRDGVMMIRKLA